MYMCVYMYIGILFNLTKRKISYHLQQHLEFGYIMLSKVKQAQINKYCMIPIMGRISNSGARSGESCRDGCQGLGISNMQEGWEMLVKVLKTLS